MHIHACCGLRASPTLCLLSVDDSGPGSFRAAINAANSRPGYDEIVLQLAEGETIHLVHELPVILDAVSIRHQSRGNGPLVVVDGSALSSGSGLTFLGFSADGSSVRDVVLQRFPGHGIRIVLTRSVRVERCHLLQNGLQGLLLDGKGRPQMAVIGGREADRCVISGNGNHGIMVSKLAVSGSTTACL